MTQASAEQIKKDLISHRLVDPVIRFFESFFSTFPIFTWDADERRTRMLVMGFESFVLEKVDAKPRIVVELVDVNWNNLAVDHMQHLDLQTTAMTSTDMVNGILTAHCVSKNAAEARDIADIVLEALRRFRPELRKEGGFFNVDTVGYTRIQRIRTSSTAEVRSAPVTIRLSLKRTYTAASDEARYQAAGG